MESMKLIVGNGLSIMVKTCDKLSAFTLIMGRVCIQNFKRRQKKRLTEVENF